MHIRSLVISVKISDNTTNNGDDVTANYLLSAQKFLLDSKYSDIEYVGGCSISPVLDAIQTLAYSGELIFSNSVAYSLKDRIEEEFAAINQEYEYCKLVYHISDSYELFDQLILIIRNSESESEAIDKLQSEMTLNADEAEFIQNLSISALSDKELISEKEKSMYFLLTYMKYLKP